MDFTKIAAETKKMAELTAFELAVPKAELDHEFNQYWAQTKDLLPKDLVAAAMKGGYRTLQRDRVVQIAGGPGAFFRPILADLMVGYLDTQPRQAIAIPEVTLLEGLEQYTIRALVYLEPEVTWKKEVPGLKAPMVIRMPKEPPDLLERSVQAELENCQEQSAILRPVAEGVKVAEGHFLALSCESVIEGQKWEPGCFENKKWLMRRDLFRVPGMMDELLGMGVGETKKFNAVLNDKFSAEVQGKTVQVTLRLGQIYDRTVPPIDDDLAKNFGLPDLASLRGQFTAKCGQEIEAGKRRLMLLSATSQLMNPEMVEVEPVPYAWMLEKAKELYGEGRKTVRTEEELIQSFEGQKLLSGDPVNSKESLLTFLAERAAQSLVFDLVMRSWGKLKGLGKPEEQRLDAMGEFVDAVKNSILAESQIEYYDVTPEGAPDATV